jgi:hypothetical protein
MITFFPVSYEDEILYSIIARYHIQSGNISIKSTLSDLYGCSSITSVIDLPSHIDKIISNLPIDHQFTSDELIDKFTLFNYYSSFVPPENSETIRKYMKGDNGGSIYNKIGLMASSITLNKFVKFCPDCMKEDLVRYGEIYWHRIHQVSGVLICPKHHVFLIDSTVNSRGFNKHEFIAATYKNCIIKENYKKYSGDELNKIFFIAKNAEKLLNNNFERKSIKWFCNQYINVLKKIGYASVNGKVKQKDLIRNFKEYYGEELLLLFQSNFNVESENNWLSDLVRRKNKTTHPLRHLLFIQFLGITLEELFNKEIEYKPFGNGPWPCLNPAAEHFKEDVINYVDIRYSFDTKKPIGSFACSCGFIYTRTGSDVDHDARFRIGKVQSYGQVWKQKLRDLVLNGKSIYEISKILDVDPATVKKYIDITFGTPPCQDISGNCTEVYISDDVENNKKNEWLTLIQQYPDKSKTELRKLKPALYTWLYRNCKEWLSENSPKKVEFRYENSRVNWEERDNKILMLAREKVQEILKREGKPKRITISIIGSELGIRPLLGKHLDKLPMTEKYLNEQTESITEFQHRRIDWAIKELNEEGKVKELWRVYRKAGIRKEYQDELKEIVK